jgi:hypothetical protein
MDFTATGITLAATEVVRLFTLKSGDRILSLQLSNSTAWAGTVLTVDVGLHKAGGHHDGPALDIDLFAAAQDLLATLGQADILVTGGGSVTNPDRGLALWEMANLGATSYASDPMEEWDVTMTFKTVTTVTAEGILLVECAYTSAGTN